MFNYSNKTKLIAFGVLTILIVFIIWLVNYEDSRSQDILMMSQSKNLANGLERYYSQFRSYPQSEATSLVNLVSLSENGFNVAGNVNYWFLDQSWLREGIYQSDGQQYTIQFNLNHGWQALGLKAGGGLCQLLTGVVWQCVSQ